MPQTKRPDYITIRLTQAARKIVGDATLTISNSRLTNHTISGDEEIEVERSYDWNMLLRQRRINGVNLFEVVPDASTAPAAPAASTAAPAAAAPATSNAEATHAAEGAK